VGLEPARFSNPDLTWETTEQINAGLDFGLLKGRIEGSIDLYSKKTADLLFNKPLPLQTGFGSQWVNLENGKIVNKGIEFADCVAYKKVQILISRIDQQYSLMQPHFIYFLKT
jgi:outer membrane cobalamin receptor